MRRVIVASALAAGLAVGGATVHAMPAWRTFGTGMTQSRFGILGSGSLSVSSTTRRDPAGMRFVITGTGDEVSVNYYATCWDEATTTYVSKSKDLGDRSVPYTYDVPHFWGATHDFCTLDVFVFAQDNGKVKLKLQGRY
jgi:hypothetical protein